MYKEDFERLDIQSVSQTKLDEWDIRIHFTADGLSYRLIVSKDRQDKYFTPQRVEHEIKHCPLCNNRNKYHCDGFSRHIDDLFQRLIQYPNIRLEWVFLPHHV